MKVRLRCFDFMVAFNRSRFIFAASLTGTYDERQLQFDSGLEKGQKPLGAVRVRPCYKLRKSNSSGGLITRRWFYFPPLLVWTANPARASRSKTKVQTCFNVPPQFRSELTCDALEC